MTKKAITGEGLHSLIVELEQTAYRLNGTNSGYLMADAAAVLREFYAAEPVADVVEWRKEGEERTCDIRWRRFDVAPGPLYSIPQPQNEQQNIPKNIPVITEQSQQPAMKAVCAVCGENCTHPHHHPMTAVPVDPPLTPEAGAAINTLKHLHYTWTGGEHWRPPLGLPPESVTGIDYKKLVEEISRIVFGNLDHVEHLPIVIRATFGRYQSCP